MTSLLLLLQAGPRWYHKPLNLTIAVKEGRRDATKGVGFRQLKYFEVSTKVTYGCCSDPSIAAVYRSSRAECRENTSTFCGCTTD